ncbi:MAG: dTMP kinase [Chloroflexi bacterium]|nr:dTMP kinase [Chloroflexota bacterium]
MSLFITLEGGEGCGKSAQARILSKRLAQLAIPFLLTQEPGGTALGARLRRWLKWTQNETFSPLSELLLFNAARAQLVTEVIQPGLDSGNIVICDRYTDSTIAYQGYGRGLESALVKTINDAATGGLKPDLTVLLDLPAEEGLARKKARRRDRFEHESIAFHRRVRQGYLKLASAEPERWLVIDATQSKDKIAQIIWHKVSQLLASRGKTEFKAAEA